MSIDPLNIGAILIAVLTALGSWASLRSSAKASIINARTTAEVEAYGRARAMDIKTIERQDGEIEEIKQQYDEMNIKFKQMSQDNLRLHAENLALRRKHSQEIHGLRAENKALVEKLARLEKQIEENDDEQDV